MILLSRAHLSPGDLIRIELVLPCCFLSSVYFGHVGSLGVYPGPSPFFFCVAIWMQISALYRAAAFAYVYHGDLLVCRVFHDYIFSRLSSQSLFYFYARICSSHCSLSLLFLLTLLYAHSHSRYFRKILYHVLYLDIIYPHRHAHTHTHNRTFNFQAYYTAPNEIQLFRLHNCV